MRLRFSLLVALVCAGAATGCDRNAHSRSPSVSGAVVFGSAPLTTGTVVTRSESGTMAGKARVRARRVHVEIRTSETRSSTILATRGAAPSDVRVTYDEVSSGSTDSVDGSSNEAHPTQGNSYRVRRRGGSIKVTRTDGRKMGVAEAIKVRSDVSLSTADFSVIEELRGRTVPFGKTFTSSGLRPSGSAAPDDTRMTLVDRMTRAGREIAVFEIEMAGSHMGGRYTIEGEALVDVETAALLRLSGLGPFRYREAGATMRGQVALSIKFDYAYP